MTKIIEKKRIFKTTDDYQTEYGYTKNPKYNPVEAARADFEGRHYPEPELLEIRKMVRKKTSHIQYRIVCDYCGGKNAWVGRKDAKYCSAGCRKMAYNEKNKASSQD